MQEYLFPLNRHLMSTCLLHMNKSITLQGAHSERYELLIILQYSLSTSYFNSRISTHPSVSRAHGCLARDYLC